MEIGDKVVCKKDFDKFKTNVTYSISDIHQDKITVSQRGNSGLHTFLLKKEKRQMWICHICPKSKECYNNKLFKYYFFSSVKEFRRLKLEEINGNR